MAANRINCYAMHTNFDSAPGCMGDLVADQLGVQERKPLEPLGQLQQKTAFGEIGQPYGIGTIGVLPKPLTVKELAGQVKERFDLSYVTLFGEEAVSGPIRNIAICPGSGGSEIEEAIQSGAQLLLTGDISHHEGIDASARGLAIMDAGHYGLEHIFIGFMQEYLQKKLGDEVMVITMPIHSPIHCL